MATTTYQDSTFSVAAIGGRTDSTGAAVTDFTAEEARFTAQILNAGYIEPTNAFIVRESVSPGMSVRVGSDSAKTDYYVIAGTVGGQGNYIVRLDASAVTLTVPAADASQQRTDEVYLVIRDNTYDASSRGLPQIGYRRGDVGGASPGPDATWEAYALLASINVAAGATSILDSSITDERSAATLKSGLAVTDHGSLTGLADDDHLQYHNDARGDARYYLKAAVDSALATKSNTGHTHAATDVTSGTFSASRIPSTLNATNFSGSVDVNGTLSANTVSVDGTYVTSNSIYVDSIATEHYITSNPASASQPDPGLTFGGSIEVNGTVYSAGSSGAINGNSDHSSPWFGTDNSGPYIRLWWTGSSLQFIQMPANTVVKTFVIDHPLDPERYLVHATTESPNNGVEYWGEAEIQNGQAIVELPSYFEALCSTDNRQVQVSVILPDEPNNVQSEPDREITETVNHPVFDQKTGRVVREKKQRVRIQHGRPAQAEQATLPMVAASRPKDGMFRISSNGPDGTKVAWLVKAVRKDVPALNVEPLRSENNLLGNGPYTYLVPKDENK